MGGEGRTFPVRVSADGVSLVRDGALLGIDVVRTRHDGEAAGEADPQLVSPMPGTVVVTRVADGDHVEVGDPVVVVEAMKMEHVVHSTVAGTVALHARVGDTVSRGQTLASPVGSDERGSNGRA